MVMARSYRLFIGLLFGLALKAHAESAHVCLMRIEDAAEDQAKCGLHCDSLTSALEQKKQDCRDSGFTEEAIADAVKSGRARLKPLVSRPAAAQPSRPKPAAKPKPKPAPASFKERNALNFARLLPGTKGSTLHQNYNAGSCRDAYLGDGSRFIYVGHKKLSGSAEAPGGEAVRLFIVRMEPGECYPSQADKKNKLGATAVYNLPLSLLDMWKRGEGLRRTPFSGVRVGDLRVTYCSTVIKCSHMMR